MTFGREGAGETTLMLGEHCSEAAKTAAKTAAVINTFLATKNSIMRAAVGRVNSISTGFNTARKSEQVLGVSSLIALDRFSEIDLHEE